MRDIAILGVFLTWLPFAFVRPHAGVLLLSWLSYMNPQRLTWGFAYSLPLSYVAAIVTILAFVFSAEKKTIPMNPVVVVWFMFLAWISVTTIFSLNPDLAVDQLIKVMKINIIILLTLALFQQKDRIHQLLWVIVVSLGFYGVKGGFFTIVTGGGFRVWGPAGTFIAGNNELAVALLMTVPLMVYFHGHVEKAWQKNIMLMSIFLTVAAILGTQSRGALIGVCSVGLFYWFKSSRKFVSFILVLMISVIAMLFLPDAWFERMSTISDYQNDASAMGRIYAWEFAINVANERVFGGGFWLWNAVNYLAYLPSFEPGQKAFVAHSIYFGILGEHGWIGLALFLLVFFLAWRMAGKLVREFRDSVTDKWVSKLAAMLQVSLIAYLSGGAFLSLSYFDLPWHLVIIIVLVRQCANKLSNDLSLSDTKAIQQSRHQPPVHRRSML